MHQPDRLFPADFLVGSTTSAFQLGAGFAKSDWASWTRRLGLPREHRDLLEHPSQPFEKDLNLPAKLGYTVHLHALSWPEIQPQSGRFDADALERASRNMQMLRAKGLRPIVALHHAALPAWFADKGGWRRSDAAEAFVRYAAAVCDAVGPACEDWIPMLEPRLAWDLAWRERVWPPGRGIWSAGRSRRNMLGACRRVAGMLRSQGARAGSSIRGNVVDPADGDSPWDFRAALRERAMRTGKYLDSRQKGAADRPDFILLNCFGRERVRFSLGRPSMLFAQYATADGEDVALGSAEPSADALRQAMETFGAADTPLFLATGVATERDDLRQAYVLDAFAAVADLRQQGAPVKGFLVHSLLDGFEWHKALGARYGLVHVDFASGTRTPNPSAYMLGDVCRNRRLPSRVRKTAT